MFSQLKIYSLLDEKSRRVDGRVSFGFYDES